jgi:hypothetical protein
MKDRLRARLKKGATYVQLAEELGIRAATVWASLNADRLNRKPKSKTRGKKA